MAGEEESAPPELEPSGAAEGAELTGMEPIRETTGSAGGGEDLVHKARGLMRRIVAGRAAPSPCLLHSLAGILEHEESRYEQHAGHPYTSNSWSSHTIGRLVNLTREDENFFELVSSRFLVEPGHPTNIRAAAARLLLACVSSLMYPHVFVEDVLANIKQWVIEEPLKATAEGGAGKSVRSAGPKTKKDSDTIDREMLRTYATGLLAVALGGGDVVEDVLTTGMVGHLMHYLRVRVLGDAAADASVENRPIVGATGNRGRDEARGRVRPPLEASRMEDIRGTEIFSEEQVTERGGERVLDVKGKRKDQEEGLQEESASLEGRDGVETPDVSLCTYDADEDADDWLSEDKRRRKDRRDGKNRTADWFSMNRPLREDESEELGRAEPSKRRIDLRDRGGGKGRGKGRGSDGAVELDRGQVPITTPVRKENQVHSVKSRGSLLDRNGMRPENGFEGQKDAGLRDDSDSEKEDMKSVFVGKADIALVLQRAKRAAQAEAKAANAPWEAVKAAGDAAADLVKVAASEALGESTDEAGIMAAADRAAASVVDAAVSTNVSREQMENNKIAAEEALEAAEEALEAAESVLKKEHECELEDKAEAIVDVESVAVLRERYCVQCLEKMGEYLEVLGPVLHERGVDVCLALLQRRPKDNSPKDVAMLSDVLKLICALAAHRKFAALLVDRGGVQQLLLTPKVPQTLTGISLCLFAFASLQGVMERVCTLPASVVQDIVALGLQLLGCAQDPARRNAALFFGASFVFRAILDAFDTQDGLRKLLNLLRNTAALRSGGGSNNLGNAAAPAGSRGDRTLASEVLTSSGKQIAYHTCVALRQYFRAHLLLLVDSLRPYRGHKGGSRGTSGRAIYKPIDISNEAMDTIIVQLQRDRKLGPAFVKARWVPLELFMGYNGHTILLELTQQAAPGERYLHEIVQHSLGVLQIVSLVPYTRRLIVGSLLSNDRTGMAVILDAASGAAFGDPEVIQTALLVLVNLVCPPPSLCSRPMPVSNTPSASQPTQSSQTAVGNGTQGVPVGAGIAVNLESKGWAGRGDSNAERNGGTPGGPPGPAGAAVVGDRRISLGPGAGGSGLAAYMEQGYRYAREAVRSNNGIKVLLHLLSPRLVLPPAALDCIRALSCRVLLGLARDETIAHILTKLQVGKLLSELLRDGGGHAGRQASTGGIGGEQGRWQAELSRVALELIAIVTNAGRATTVAASEAAAPTLRRIERAAIAAATPISYHPRELLQLIHEHLIGSGLPTAAVALLKEANLKPLPSIQPPSSLLFPTASSEGLADEVQWPSGRVTGGFLAAASKQAAKDEDDASSSQPPASARKKPGFSISLTASAKSPSSMASFKKSLSMKESRSALGRSTDPHEASLAGKSSQEIADTMFKTPHRNLPTKRKASDRDMPPLSPSKRITLTDSGITTPSVTPANSTLKTNFATDSPSGPLSTSFAQIQESTPAKSFFGQQVFFEKVDITPLQPEALTIDVQSPYLPFMQYLNTPVHPHFPSNTGLLLEPRTAGTEHATLDSLVVQYLKHQHRQCPAPITTLPPLSLLHPHVCPEPSRAVDASLNTAGRLASRQLSPPFGGMHGRRRDRHFVYSRFRPWRTCRDEAVLLTANTFLGHASCLAAGSHDGDIRLFDSSTGNILEVQLVGHASPISLLQSAPHCLEGNGDGRVGQLLLSSATYDVRLWDSSALSNGALSVFESCKAARFNHAGSRFGAISLESSQKEVLLYDVSTYKLEQRLSDSLTTAPGLPRGHTQAMVHFSPDDVLVLWGGVLWDHRIPCAIHRFDQFTDYGGGGFHPAGNEVIINSEVWDLRSFKLLRSVPSLDQTAISFNTTGDVIYATLRRNPDDIMAAIHPRRMRHPLFSAFRTMDAADYSDITTTVVDRCVLDLATEPTDSFISIVAMESSEEMDSFARLYEVGRRRPTDDDSDPDDGGETEEEDESEGEDEDDEDGDLHDEEDIDLVSNEDEENSGEDDIDDDADADFGDSSDEGSDDELGDPLLELIPDGEDDNRGGFSSEDDGSGGEFGDDGFDDMLQGLF